MRQLRWIEYVVRMGGEEIRLQNVNVGITREANLRIERMTDRIILKWVVVV
jgi:hypothetical protein